MRKKFLILSLITFVSSAAFFILTYFTFHYFGPNGFEPTWHQTAAKPLVTQMVGQLSVLLLFAGIIFLLLALIVFKKDKKVEK